MKINNYEYDETYQGMRFEFKKVITNEDLDSFAKIVGDYNPLHCDVEFAKKKGFKDRVVYGMLAGSLFSTLVGMVCPGKNNLYLSQNLNFREPIYAGEELVIRGEILSKIDGINLLVIKTEIISNKSIKVEGVAKVRIIGDKDG
ncbi:MaoC family dehydratase [Candidatus Pacearchaeota archaeon]|nr:hypothetical protein [uncultured archaeon]MBS3076649.1 MaoC family dehydratase [Candidatus Pacearchaeota archaeon]